MAYNTKGIKTDVDKKPIPQYYNPVMDEYQVLQGENGAARHVLYGSDGNPISTDDNNKLAVRAAEIEAKLTSLEGKIDAMVSGTSPAVVQLSGRIVEYAWFSDAATKPTPTEDFAWGNEFNKSTGELKVYGWTGSAWKEVV